MSSVACLVLPLLNTLLAESSINSWASLSSVSKVKESSFSFRDEFTDLTTRILNSSKPLDNRRWKGEWGDICVAVMVGVVTV